PLEADPLLDLTALRDRALVIPEDGGTQHPIPGVERDQAVHLPRQSDAGWSPHRDPELLQHALGRPPPIFRVLLGPPGPGGVKRVAGLRPRPDRPGVVDRQPLDRRGSDVEPDERAAHPPAPDEPANCAASRTIRRAS